MREREPLPPARGQSVGARAPLAVQPDKPRRLLDPPLALPARQVVDSRVEIDVLVDG